MCGYLSGASLQMVYARRDSATGVPFDDSTRAP